MEDIEPVIFNNNSRKEGMVLSWETMIIAVLTKKKKKEKYRFELKLTFQNKAVVTNSMYLFSLFSQQNWNISVEMKAAVFQDVFTWWRSSSDQAN